MITEAIFCFFQKMTQLQAKKSQQLLLKDVNSIDWGHEYVCHVFSKTTEGGYHCEPFGLILIKRIKKHSLLCKNVTRDSFSTKKKRQLKTWTLDFFLWAA